MRLFEQKLSSIQLEPTLENWELLNYDLIKKDPNLLSMVSPFPPFPLMTLTSGLSDNFDFAGHGVHIFKSIRKACPKDITSFSRVLDFACGCGREARIFYPLSYDQFSVADIDKSMVKYMANTYSGINAVCTKPDKPLPFADNSFDLIYSISVLTHLTEKSQDLILKELNRITSPNGIIMLSVHGDRAMQRTNEPNIYNMLCVDNKLFECAKKDFERDLHAFIIQKGHLTTKKFSYGITFTSNKYIHSHFSKWFNVLDIADGAIHDFQSIVVLSPKKSLL